jgi:alcohol dehydrogenase class IV
MFSAPHGVICAQLLPYVMETNVRALQSRAPDSPVLVRYDEVAQILRDEVTARATDGIAWVQDLSQVLNVQRLGEFGLEEKDISTVVEKSQKASSMKGNPIPLTDNELIEILKRAV